MHNSIGTSILALSLVATTAAQDSPKLAVESMQASGSVVVEEGQALWAHSPHYKARFDRRGVRFTPTLGRSAPRNFPLALAVESIGRGGRQLPIGTGVHSNGLPRKVAGAVHIPRGGSVVERYLIGERSIEQTFVFAQRPAGAGDLVVRMRVASELSAPRGEARSGLRFTRTGVPGGVAIGAVTGVAADGETVPGHMNYDGEFLELVLPSPFVDAAEYPLVLDPVIGGIFSGGMSFQDRRPDIAYDATNDFYLLVWEIQRSAADTDIWGMRLKSDNTGRSGMVVVSGPGRQARPCIANINATDTFMVVWQDDNAGNWDLRGRAIEASTRNLSPVVTIADTSSDEITPDIAGEITMADDDAVCVWDDEAVGIRAVEIEVQGVSTPTVGTPIVIAPGGAPANDNPAISKSGSAARRFAVAWEASPMSLAAQAFSMDLVPASTPLRIPGTNQYPDIAGDGTDFTIAYQRPESGSPNLGDIWCVGVSVPPVSVLPMNLRVTARALAATSNDDEARPTIGFTGNRYVVAWADQMVPSTTEYRCRIQNLLGDCTACGSSSLVSRGTGRRCDWPAIATQASGGASALDGAWILFQQEELTATPPRSIVMVARYEAVVGGPVQTVAPGCGRGGVLTVDGAFSFGERVTFQLSGADPAATTGFLSAGVVGFRNQLNCGSCRLLLGLFVFSIPMRNGAAQFGADIPCDPLLLNYDLDVQIAALGTTMSPCGLIPQLSASNVLRARVRD